MFKYYSYCNYTLYLVQSEKFILIPFLKRDEKQVFFWLASLYVQTVKG
jgi:hypothetical protein